jgi:hypothetical protein
MPFGIGPLLEMSAVVTGSHILARISTSRRSAASAHGLPCRAYWSAELLETFET